MPRTILLYAPRAEDGDEYVSLGDIAEPGITPPNLDTVRLVPRWAVSTSSIARPLRASKNDKSKSLWSNRSGLGTFFGSPSAFRSVPLKSAAS